MKPSQLAVDFVLTQIPAKARHLLGEPRKPASDLLPPLLQRLFFLLFPLLFDQGNERAHERVRAVRSRLNGRATSGSLAVLGACSRHSHVSHYAVRSARPWPSSSCVALRR